MFKGFNSHLQSRALVSYFSRPLHSAINKFFAYCVVTASIVVGRVFFACD